MKPNIFLRIWAQLRDLYLYFFRHALLVNAWVDDRSWVGIHHRNWGDELNYYLMQQISGRPIVIYNGFWLARHLHFTNYLCIGTLLDTKNYSNTNTIVWGSGVSGQEENFIHPKQICSVRGKKTRQYLFKHGVECPAVYGDVALLLPRYYISTCKRKKYKLGLIPHISDLSHPIMNEIKQTRADILIIDLGHYNKWTDVIDQICSCEMIASSSLHGLIVSDAYKIPNVWLTLYGKIPGGYFKFFDYFSSVERTEKTPILLREIKDLSLIDEAVQSWKIPEIDLEMIWRVCPFFNNKSK